LAAVTETAGTRIEWITGALRNVKADITSVDDTDTWTPGLAIIEYVSFAPTTAAAGTQWGVTTTSPANRSGVVTFAVESGTLAGAVVAHGY